MKKCAKFVPVKILSHAEVSDVPLSNFVKIMLRAAKPRTMKDEIKINENTITASLKNNKENATHGNPISNIATALFFELIIFLDPKRYNTPAARKVTSIATRT